MVKKINSDSEEETTCAAAPTPKEKKEKAATATTTPSKPSSNTSARASAASAEGKEREKENGKENGKERGRSNVNKKKQEEESASEEDESESEDSDSESDDDESEEDARKKSKKGKGSASKSSTSSSAKKAAPKKRKQDSDSEEEKKNAAKKKAAAAKKSKPSKSSSKQVKKKSRNQSESEEDASSDEDDSDGSSDSDSSNDSSGDDDDSNDAPDDSKKRRRESAQKKSSSSKKSVKIKSEFRKSRSGATSEIQKKFERIEEARRAFKWWEAEEYEHGILWRKMEHCGVVFPPAYVKHNVPLIYDGEKKIELTAEQEEIASFYAAIPEDGPQLGNPKTRPVFQKNFFNDFLETLPSGHVIKKFEKCDFSLIKEHLDLQKSLKKAATDEEKAINKAAKQALQMRYGYALIDGRIEKMGNYNMEPPGLFRGRGEHPKTGALKRRCFPEEVSLNISIDSCVPRCDLPGHAWSSVRHDPKVTWLCGWNENVQQQHKYVMLAASSSFKGKSDLEKYEKAIRLKQHIAKVRKDYTSKIKDKDKATRQLGTAMWVIDVLALRVGGEKGEDEADTVGCCSLRVEHLTFNPDPSTQEIELEFLGKDSMLYKQNINFGMHGELGSLVYRNLTQFCAGKEEDEDIFDTLSPPILNKHLNSLMKGLTAKVFRTFNASITLEKELPSAEELDGLTVQEKVARYNAANRQVAILCNHQKTVSRATEVMFEGLNEKLKTLKDQRNQLLKWKEYIKSGKENKIPLKEDDTAKVEKVAARLKKATDARQLAKTDAEKLAAANLMDEVKLEQKMLQKAKFEQKHLFANIPSLSNVENRISKWAEDIRKMETDIRNRDENKEVALGTSKINYMDPRISVAWCKRCEVPIDRIFAKTLREKFNWAMAVPPDWKFGN